MRTEGHRIADMIAAAVSSVPAAASARRVTALAMAVLFATSLSPGSCGTATTGLTADELVSGVAASNLEETIQALQDFGSRDFHLESANDAATYIHDVMVGLGLAVEYQSLMVDDVEVSNVIGTLGDSLDEPMYLFGAHYDSENSAIRNLSMAENLTAPGADDDASGIAAVVEIARILSEGGTDRTVRFVAFGAEEYGFDRSGGSAGSRYFVSQEIALERRYEGTVIFDMIGYRSEDTSRAVLVTNSDSDPLASATTRSVSEFGIDLSLETMVAPGITYSDHGSFWDAGYPSILVVEELTPVRYYPVNPYYHTSEDTIDKLSMDQVVAVTQAALGGFLTVGEDEGDLTAFGVVIIAAVGVPLVAYAILWRRRHNVGDDERQRGRI